MAHTIISLANAKLWIEFLLGTYYIVANIFSAKQETKGKQLFIHKMPHKINNVITDKVKVICLCDRHTIKLWYVTTTGMILQHQPSKWIILIWNCHPKWQLTRFLAATIN